MVLREKICPWEGAPADHSLSMSDTFSTGCDDPDALRKQCRQMCDGLGKRMVEARVRGTTLTLTLNAQRSRSKLTLTLALTLTLMLALTLTRP